MQFGTFVAGVAGRLGITEASAADRVRTLGRGLVHSLALEGEKALDAALDQLLARGVEDVAKILAHGPHEQARVALAPELVHPPGTEKANLNGYLPAEDLPANDVTNDAEEPTELAE